MSDIDIKLNAKSIDKAIRLLQRYNSRITSSVREFCTKLGEAGLIVLSAELNSPQYAGTPDVDIGLELEGNSITVYAHGSTVAFIEFGTGVKNSPQGQYASVAGAVPLGEYGKKEGKKDYWLYKGEPGTAGRPSQSRPGYSWSVGNPPANAFPKAVQNIVDSIDQIAREVFVE